jgi:hypothetical protein
MSDRQLVFEDFSDKVGDTFEISEEGWPAIPLTLTEATPLNPAHGMPNVRPPFSLIFVVDASHAIPQRLYRLAHEAMGDLTIFLVPVGKDAEGLKYQATFN